MLARRLAETENKRIRKTSGLKSGCRRLRRRLTGRQYLWFERKYLFHVSSSQKSLGSLHLAKILAVL